MVRDRADSAGEGPRELLGAEVLEEDAEAGSDFDKDRADLLPANGLREACGSGRRRGRCEERGTTS